MSGLEIDQEADLIVRALASDATAPRSTARIDQAMHALLGAAVVIDPGSTALRSDVDPRRPASLAG